MQVIGLARLQNWTVFKIEEIWDIPNCEYNLYIQNVNENVTLKGVSVAARNRVGEQRKKVDIKLYKGRPQLQYSYIIFYALFHFNVKDLTA